jgi:hypothetical protein
MREDDAQHRAAEFIKELYAAGDIDASRLDSSLTGLLAAKTEAEFDDRVTDLHVYSGWGSITIIVPRGVDVQVTHHRGGVDSRLDPPLPGRPLIRLDVTAMIGKVRLRHSSPQPPARRHFRKRR